MKKIFFVLVFGVMGLLSNVMGQENETIDDPDATFFHADSLISELQSGNKRWMSFIKGKNVLTGLYTLRTGEEDGQQPHDTDEVYYVIEGKAKFVAGGKETVVSEGSVLFVKAEVEHRFKEIEEDLVVLVFFDQ